MRKIFYLLLIIFTAASNKVNAQNAPIDSMAASNKVRAQNTPIDSIANVSIFTTDALGKVYVVSGGSIIKMDQQGRVLNTFNMKNFGDPTQLDARDPFKLIVLYADYGMVRLLDNQLGEQSVLDLRQEGYADPRVVSGTAAGNLWVYDLSSSQLSKLDLTDFKTQLTIDLRQMIGQSPVPQNMEVSQSWMAMLNQNEVLIFDQYGSFVKRIPLKDKNQQIFQLVEDNLYTSENGKIIRFNLALNSVFEEALMIPPTGSKARLLGNDLWFIRNGWLIFPKH